MTAKEVSKTAWNTYPLDTQGVLLQATGMVGFITILVLVVN